MNRQWLIVFVIGIFMAMPASISWAGPAGIVSVDEVNLRNAPNADSVVIGVLHKKDVVEILTNRNPCLLNDYFRVRVSRTADESLVNEEGWIFAKYLYIPQPD